MSACKDDMVPRHGFSPQQGIDDSVDGEGQIIIFEYKYSDPIHQIKTSWPFSQNQLGVMKNNIFYIKICVLMIT